MNYLAHLYLSGSDHDLLLGNFIADAVKGKQLEQYPERVQQGIRLHRAIDTFTDQHEVVRQSKRRLYSGYSKFAGVITDIFYDHFLAVNWQQYHPQPLLDYTKEIYELLQQNWHQLPPRVQHFLPYMMRDNWLLRYGQLEGIGSSLTGLSRRVPHAQNLAHAVQELEKDFDLYLAEFELFFPDLEAYVKDRIGEIQVKV